MICLDCAKLDLRTFPQHAKTGFGRCQNEKMAGVFESITYQRECGQFMQASAEVKQARHVWYVNLGKVK